MSRTGDPTFGKALVEIAIRGDRKVLSAIASAMLPETTQIQERGKKCRLSMKDTGRESGSFAMVFESKDLVSLRASVNTNLRLVASALKTLARLQITETSKKGKQSLLF